ncbi:MAG TPA: RNA polymerase [Prolixibacteraceae bacterium]|nr:RNA polymerase [Prolixibacteraceae bacterium]
MKIDSGINEATLIQRCKKNDEKAQLQLYRLYSKRMFNLAVRMTGDVGEAEDVLQDSFVKALTELHKLKDENAFGGWLKRIVINRSIDKIRNKKFKFLSIETIHELKMEIPEELDESVDPEIVHHLIKKLPDGAREILVLRALEGFKHAEIAEKLRISESTAKTQFFRAKQLLAKMIKEMENENEFRKIPEGKPAEA